MEPIKIHLNRVKQQLDEVSSSYCVAKWQQVTIHLATGQTHSCHHPATHHIPLEEIAINPSALHNTKFKKPIVFSGEKCCHPDASLSKHFDHIKSPFKYLNSGTYIGYSKNILEMLKSLTIKPNEDDQLFATKYIIKNPLLCAIDKKCQIFLTLYNVDKSELSIEKKLRVFVKKFKARPCVIHGNGPSKSILDKLF